jgi:hypothetical protein
MTTPLPAEWRTQFWHHNFMMSPSCANEQQLIFRLNRNEKDGERKQNAERLKR